ncbi:unnamed protein product [Polarella glacialis]|uniref:Uncharacterized protein n=1 Tax=Polarella glacialis TaxID=89957 RepID=A0A813ETQ8_POLGL|nr:unnamed protein product [Polarella glacialis]CAE8658247.1 unnamed protein product [Polarella glacialis]
METILLVAFTFEVGILMYSSPFWLEVYMLTPCDCERQLVAVAFELFPCAVCFDQNHLCSSFATDDLEESFIRHFPADVLLNFAKVVQLRAIASDSSFQLLSSYTSVQFVLTRIISAAVFRL